MTTPSDCLSRGGNIRNVHSRRSPRIFEDRVEILLTRGKVAVIDIVDVDLAQFNWTAIKPGLVWYTYRRGPRPNKEMIYLHRVVARRAGLLIDGIETDHQNGDGLNCRRGNLRAATHAQNAHNSPLRADNRSGYKGVSWHKRRRKWRAYIVIGQKQKALGYFDDPVIAAGVRAVAAQRLHGDYARAG